MERFKKICMHIVNRKIIGDQYDSMYNLFIKLLVSLEDYVALKEGIINQTDVDKKDKELIDKLTILQNDFQQHRL